MTEIASGRQDEVAPEFAEVAAAAGKNSIAGLHGG